MKGIAPKQSAPCCYGDDEWYCSPCWSTLGDCLVAAGWTGSGSNRSKEWSRCEGGSPCGGWRRLKQLHKTRTRYVYTRCYMNKLQCAWSFQAQMTACLWPWHGAVCRAAGTPPCKGSLSSQPLVWWWWCGAHTHIVRMCVHTTTHMTHTHTHTHTHTTHTHTNH